MVASGHGPLAAQVALRIAAARRLRGWTQDQLAEALAIAPRNVQRIESGRQNLTLETIEKVARVLGVEPESLLPRQRASLWTEDSGARPPLVVPLLAIDAAAGYLREPRNVDASGWCIVDQRDEGVSFAVRVSGDSMRPLLEDEALAVFRAPAGPLTRGLVYLWQVRPRGSPEDGGSYVIKRYDGLRGENTGRPTVQLGSINPRHRPLIFKDQDDVMAIARLVEALPG